MKFTVAICTWNRASLLRRTLESLTAQRNLQGVAWELLVVNNNCTDETDAVIAAFDSRLPIRRLHEPVPGLSNARNTAIAAAAGDYIVWTDDDVVVCPEWLSAHVQAFRTWPDHAVFGGPIRPEFEGKLPKWLVSVLPDVEIAYGIRNIPTAGDLSIIVGNEPFGANFSVRSDLQRSHPYDSRLGKSPRRPYGVGEETLVIRAILEEGHLGRWLPDAVVHHWVPRSRQSTRHIRDYWKGHGMRRAMFDDFSDQLLLLGIPRWMIRARFEYEFRYRIGRAIGRPRKWIQDLMRVGEVEGQIAFIRGSQRRRVP